MNRRNFISAGASSIVAPFVSTPTTSAARQNPSVMPQPGADGWIPLFNGRNLDGWYTFLQNSGKNSDPSGIFRVDNGMLHIFGQRVTDSTEPGYLCTTREFANYRLRVEYRWGTERFAPRTDYKRDNGLLLHVTGDDRVFPMCMEFQVQEADVGDAIPVGGVRYVPGGATAGLPRWPVPAPGGGGQAGAARGAGAVGPAAVGAAGGVGTAGRAGGGGAVAQPTTALTPRVSDFENREGWNIIECICRGADCAFIVNGRIVNTIGRMERPDPPVFQGRGAPPPAAPLQYVPLDRGRIGVEAEYAEIWFRRIDIRPLTAGELG